ncbi:hypothetical protein L226DRAFT_545760 [Lentinus tigrinus ALCF2SS1-7]|uniref:Uncharacterized protein n=1 Tax=Lentinus tigrinus ALCF2SS1-6 TaxID=1328759 RepID=A0A5C2SAG5_9APHY|nr:hypothetical protein L227DRAFT_502256 [Lentinus tigrinus ALCF2SS1-6]RPD74852.1 hypothetical protein L226DRAFT_545760 [Lentinus tigrinus ALCF2SS1-7]
MHGQRSAAAPVLSLVMPHPSLPRRRSSMLSSVSDPHTPPPRNSPLPMLSPSANRKSSDSWNSSNYDAADDTEWEWTPEQTRLLSRTLDALPSHLLTPFNGPVPPSATLDKIAKGIIHAKGPAEWPHSLRATRAKIIELARLRVKDDTASDTIAEEESTDPDVSQQTTNKRFKRPLYRQSSMDFMQPTKLDPAENETIARLSHRLQHAERMFPNPAYACTSPRLRTSTRTLASTASSTTLNSQSSCGSSSRIPRLRRSLSSISNSSDSYIQQPGMDPRVQRIRRTESFAGSALYPPGSPLKCAPSFGSISKRSSDAMSVDCSNRSDVTTSDEEEKLRTKKAKKPRTKAASPTPPATLSSPPSSMKQKQLRRTSKQVSKPTSSGGTKDTSRRSSRPKANLQRNPSMFGPELPSMSPSSRLEELVCKSPKCSFDRGPSLLSEARRHLTKTPSSSLHVAECRKSSRPSSRPSLNQASVGRKISFSKLAPPREDENMVLGDGQGLGSAFQLR